jgi:hypothetical protein
LERQKKSYDNTNKGIIASNPYKQWSPPSVPAAKHTDEEFHEKGYIDEFVKYQNNIYSYDYPQNGEMPIGVKYPNHPLGEVIFNWICAFIFFLLCVYITYLLMKDYEFPKDFSKILLYSGFVLVFMLLPNILIVLVGFGMFRKYKAKKRDIEIYKERAKRYKKRKVLRKKQN